MTSSFPSRGANSKARKSHRRFVAVLMLGGILTLGGGALAVGGVDYSWTYYWIGWAVMSAGIILVVAAAESAT